jgi:hypothetical protein
MLVMREPGQIQCACGTRLAAKWEIKEWVPPNAEERSKNESNTPKESPIEKNNRDK